MVSLPGKSKDLKARIAELEEQIEDLTFTHTAELKRIERNHETQRFEDKAKINSVLDELQALRSLKLNARELNEKELELQAIDAEQKHHEALLGKREAHLSKLEEAQKVELKKEYELITRQWEDLEAEKSETKALSFTEGKSEGYQQGIEKGIALATQSNESRDELLRLNVLERAASTTTVNIGEDKNDSLNPFQEAVLKHFAKILKEEES